MPLTSKQRAQWQRLVAAARDSRAHPRIDYSPDDTLARVDLDTILAVADALAQAEAEVKRLAPALAKARVCQDCGQPLDDLCPACIEAEFDRAIAAAAAARPKPRVVGHIVFDKPESS